MGAEMRKAGGDQRVAETVALPLGEYAHAAELPGAGFLRVIEKGRGVDRHHAGEALLHKDAEMAGIGRSIARENGGFARQAGAEHGAAHRDGLLRGDGANRKCSSEFDGRMVILPVPQMKLFSLFLFAGAALLQAQAAAPDGNRFSYLQDGGPFYPHTGLAKLITPQWVGEDGVDAVVILSIDDLRETHKWEAYVRPVNERLKQIDGRAPFSLMCCQTSPEDPQFQTWLKEGCALEVHTLVHPCPLLGKGGFGLAEQTVLGGLDLISRIPGNHPRVFRMPCCDSMDSASPRFFAEILPQKSPDGHLFEADSSVVTLPTPADTEVPHDLMFDGDGKERFRKYFPMELKPPRKVTFDRFGGYIENYPYPYLVSPGIWEFPIAVPSDWEAFNCHGTLNLQTVEDWKRALDITVLKKGVMTLVVHPHGWSRPDELVELVDYAVAKYGKRVKFLNFEEALDRLQKNVLDGRPVRESKARLLDLDGDGYMDVVLENSTFLWHPITRRWTHSGTPAEANPVFGVLNGTPAMFGKSVWKYGGAPSEHDEREWKEDPSAANGLPAAAEKGIFRDFDHDGQTDILLDGKVYAWSDGGWKEAPITVPAGLTQRGLMFADLNGDGFDDIIFSDENRYGIYLWAKTVKPNLGWTAGWSDVVRQGVRTGAANEPPPLVRAGTHPNNGGWVRNGALYVQNEDTWKLDAVVDRRTFADLIAFDVVPPKSPAEGLASMHVHPGFRVELAASEPKVQSPIAFDWDAQGRLWVVEMRDYPLGLDGHGKPGGVVKILESTKGDGHYDKVTVVAEGLSYPTGLLPWREGALISVAPEILYLKPDGTREPLYRGFTEGNQQHRVNGFEYGIDNWIYAANGDSGGSVSSVKTGAKVELRGRDLRIRPDTGEIEAIEGETQFGRHCDDWGNWFGNYNSAWLWHYPIPEGRILRNPLLNVKSLKNTLADYPDSTRVFALSPPVIRFNQPQSLGHVTSGCSAIPYRDNLFGPDFASSVFICEPVHNAVHREVLEPDAASFTSHRAPEEAASEFLASTDNWFRPTMARTGPDGALYVSDMYRFVIEHPEWISPEVQARLNLRAGEDRGRIYRILPEGRAPRPIPNLAALDTAGLVAALDSPNGWQRTTAQRLLVERKDPGAAPALERLIEQSSEPKARFQALGTLDGLGALSAGVLSRELLDANGDVRALAVRLSEHAVAASAPWAWPQLSKLKEDSNARVRLELALVLGSAPPSPAVGELLGQIALRDGNDPYIRLAVLSSAPPHFGALLDFLLGLPTGQRPLDLTSEVMSYAVDGGDAAQFDRMLRALTPAGEITASDYLAASAFLKAVERRQATLAGRASAFRKESNNTWTQFSRVMDSARALAANAASSQPESLAAALGLLGFEPRHDAEDRASLAALLQPTFAPAVQSAALAALTRMPGSNTSAALLAAWDPAAPAMREQIVGTLLTRADWRGDLLHAIERNSIEPSQLGAASQQLLLRSSDSRVRERAARLFHPAASDRQALVQRFLSSLAPAGDAARGHEIFRTQCTLCHRLKGEGNEVGPDLAMMAGKPVDQLVTAILDPNQAVEPRYIAYSITTTDGRAFAGVISSETGNSLTLKAPGGVEQTFLRRDLKELTSLKRSLMPEGLEQVLPPAQMADLLAYLNAPAGK